MKNIIGQDVLLTKVEKVFDIFKASKKSIRPHFFLTGPSGSGKSLTIKEMCAKYKFRSVEINAAALTKEGTSGNSLSKALSSLRTGGDEPTVVFVDEFDKLFISGNTNSELAHEATNGVQNEFLKVLESETASVFGDYGKYIDVPTANCLFVFAGAFNGKESVSIDDLRSFGIKTEFIGRVGLVFNTKKLSKEALFSILDNSPLLVQYLKIFTDVNKGDVVTPLRAIITDSHHCNTLGARQVNTLIHQYFITGGDVNQLGEEVVFTETLQLN